MTSKQKFKKKEPYFLENNELWVVNWESSPLEPLACPTRKDRYCSRYALKSSTLMPNDLDFCSFCCLFCCLWVFFPVAEKQSFVKNNHVVKKSSLSKIRVRRNCQKICRVYHSHVSSTTLDYCRLLSTTLNYLPVGQYNASGQERVSCRAEKGPIRRP